MRYHDKTIDRLNDTNMACIFDDLTRLCFKDSCNLINISPDDWKYKFLNFKPDIFMVESAWCGYKNSWGNIISSSKEEKLKPLSNILTFCKKNDIPTIFWNKEDPVSFDLFLPVAKKFDYVFTTDEGCIVKYKNELNHKRVYSLLFAANPKIHNPIKILEERNSKACFAGAYYRLRYPQRCEDLNEILDAAVNTIGLEIYDRNYKLGMIQYRFPKKYMPFVKGSLEAEELDIANKGYKVMINVNSIKNSNTMFSRRVFEGLACGTPVVSSYSKGIKNIFKDLVFMGNCIDDIEKEFLRLSQDENYYENKVIKGIRYILNNHTYNHRLIYILSKSGIGIKEEVKNIAVISKVNSKDDFNKFIEMYNKQTYRYKKLIIITNNKNIIKLKKYNKNISYVLYDEKSKYKFLDNFINEEYISIINVKNNYGENYLEDLINATLYTDADFIGKKSYYIEDKEQLKCINKSSSFKYVNNIDLDKGILKFKSLSNYTLEELVQDINKNYIKLDTLPIKYFSIDNFNLICKI